MGACISSATLTAGGEGGIRTHGRGFNPYKRLAGAPVQPLRHLPNFHNFRRRERDSNPRWVAPQRFSRPPPSSTRPSLRCSLPRRWHSTMLPGGCKAERRPNVHSPRNHIRFPMPAPKPDTGPASHPHRPNGRSPRRRSRSARCSRLFVRSRAVRSYVVRRRRTRPNPPHEQEQNKQRSFTVEEFHPHFLFSRRTAPCSGKTKGLLSPVP